MRRAALRATFVLPTLAAFAAAARGDAPPDQYGFFNGSSATITDGHTGLTWQRQLDGTQRKFSDAAAYCAAMNVGAEPPGWRVPSYKELETLVDPYPHGEYTNGVQNAAYIDPNAFFGTPTDAPFWTSSIAPGGTKGYYVLFGDGSSGLQALGLGSYVRCVYGGR